MKVLTKSLFIIAVALGFVFSAFYLFIAIKGKAVITSRLEALTHRKVTIESFKMSVPLNAEIKNLNIEGLVKVESISISPSIHNLIVGRIALNNVRVVKPEVNFEKKAPELPEAAEAETVPLAVKLERKFPRRLIFKRLNIKDGRINFSDHTVGPEGIRITVKDLNLNLVNLYSFPYATITNFNLSGSIPWQEGVKEGKISLEGWMNFRKKDMQAAFKIESIDGVYLYPYYSKWVDLDKARIERASLNFISNINGLNNNITADCHLELTDIVRRPAVPGEEGEKMAVIADQVMDIFRALNQGKIVLDFTIRTKMDRPQFGFGNIKMAVEDKLAKVRNGNGLKVEDLLLLPTRVLEGTIKATTNLSKTVIDSAFDIGNEFKRAVESTFKKEPQEEPKEQKD